MIRTPKQFPSPPAFECAAGELPENDQKRIVEPDNGFGFCPDDIAYNMIIPRDDPARSLYRFFDASPEYFGWCFGPVGFPVKGIQFDEVGVKFVCELFCQCGFA